jgi:hypothetical protein
VGDSPDCSGTACDWNVGAYVNISKYDNGNLSFQADGPQLGTTFFAGYRIPDAINPADYYYGWLRLQLPASSFPDNANALTLVDWAYESVANQQIIAGAGIVPAPLPALGAAAALAASRRLRRRIAAAKSTELQG